MGIVAYRLMDDIAAPTPTARVRQRGSAAALPLPGRSVPLSPLPGELSAGAASEASCRTRAPWRGPRWLTSVSAWLVGRPHAETVPSEFPLSHVRVLTREEAADRGQYVQTVSGPAEWVDGQVKLTGSSSFDFDEGDK